jgi:hypothetical protein
MILQFIQLFIVSYKLQDVRHKSCQIFSEKMFIVFHQWDMKHLVLRNQTRKNRGEKKEEEAEK